MIWLGAIAAGLLAGFFVVGLGIGVEVWFFRRRDIKRRLAALKGKP